MGGPKGAQFYVALHSILLPTSMGHQLGDPSHCPPFAPAPCYYCTVHSLQLHCTPQHEYMVHLLINSAAQCPYPAKLHYPHSAHCYKGLH